MFPRDVFVTQTVVYPLTTSAPESTHIVVKTVTGDAILTTTARVPNEGTSTVTATFTRTQTASSAPSTTKTALPTRLQALPSRSPVVAPTLQDFGSSSSSKLGLAIGIPLAVITVFVLVVLGWIFFRKRMIAQTKELALSDSEQMLGSELEKQQLEEPKKKPSLANRISRVFNVSEWPASPMEFKSPAFLRRFHLLSDRKANTDKDTKVLPKLPSMLNNINVDAQLPVSLEEPLRLPKRGSLEKGECLVVVKPYTRRLVDELTILVGERVTLQHTDPSGWVTVQRLGGTAKGVVPLNCLQRVECSLEK